MRRGTAGTSRTRDRPLELTTPRSDVRIRSPDHSRVHLMSRYSCRPDMAESKGEPNRLRSLRDSVKKITKRLSEGNGEMIHKNDEHAREIEKLRVQIQSMEEEIRRLYQ
jgi:hypothetical protein